jgi:hypothetical protein
VPSARSLTRLQPLSERGLALTRRSASEKAGDADIFVEVGPVNAFAPADQSPMFTFRRCPVREARVPWQRHAHGAAVDEIDDQGVLGDGHPLGQRGADLTRRSAQAGWPLRARGREDVSEEVLVLW